MRPLALLLLAIAAFAQRTPQPAPLISPEILADAQVTFRLRAPKATEVALRGQWMPPQTTVPMIKSEEGDWSVTVGPIEPELYNYSFVVDGTSMVDPANPLVTQGNRGPQSMLDVMGPKVNFFAWRDVPHGTVHVHHYNSASVHANRRIHVYTPPGYESGKDTYPVLYLLHGSGDTDMEWSTIGRAGMITDNLFSDGRVRPMIIVMPDGHVVKSGDRSKNTELFESDLVGDIIPLVEKTYRVKADRESRALAGLSMGGSQTLRVGLDHPDMFAYFGVFSSGVSTNALDDFKKRHEDFLAKGADWNKQIRLFWVGMGKEDTGVKNAQTLIEVLKSSGVETDFHPSDGGHTWQNWRNYLAAFLPRLFRERS
ncbi:MAG: alpha/beta hydrolase-fold protein [Acidobacteriota bacterium]